MKNSFVNASARVGIAACLLLLFFNLPAVYGQKLEITPQYGYQVGAKWNYYGGYVKLQSSDQYGVALGLNLNDNLQVEFFWAQQNSTVSVKDVILYPIEQDVTDAQVDHFQFGIIHNFGFRETMPFVGMSAGWSTFNPDVRVFDSNTSFSLGFTGGLKHFFTDRIGIRLQGQLLMPVQWGGVYVGTGGTGFTTGGSILQLNFSGGLIIAI